MPLASPGVTSHSETSGKEQDNDDAQQDADEAVAAVTIGLAVALAVA